MTIIPTSKKYWFGRKILKKICYRDCIRLDGEIIMCKECGEKTVECNYKNTVLLDKMCVYMDDVKEFLGDYGYGNVFEVLNNGIHSDANIDSEELKLNKKYNSVKRLKKSGLYYRFGICEKCLKKKRSADSIIVDDIFLYDLLINNKVFSQAEEKKWRSVFKDHMLKSMTKELLSKVAPDEYEVLMNTEIHGSKKEFNRAAYKYAEDSWPKWKKYMLDSRRPGADGGDEIRSELEQRKEGIRTIMKQLGKMNSSKIKLLIKYREDVPGVLGLTIPCKRGSSEYYSCRDAVTEYSNIKKKSEIYLVVTESKHILREDLSEELQKKYHPGGLPSLGEISVRVKELVGKRMRDNRVQF